MYQISLDTVVKVYFFPPHPQPPKVVLLIFQWIFFQFSPYQFNNLLSCLFCSFRSKSKTWWEEKVSKFLYFPWTWMNHHFSRASGFSLILRAQHTLRNLCVESWGLNVNCESKVREWYFVTFSQSCNILSPFKHPSVKNRLRFSRQEILLGKNWICALISKKIENVTFVSTKCVCIKNQATWISLIIRRQVHKSKLCHLLNCNCD